MTSTARPAIATTGPRWRALPRVAQITVQVILMVAVGVEVVTVAVSRAPVIQYVPAVAMTAGILLGRFGRSWGYVGLGLVALAPMIAVLVDRQATGIWSMACLAAFWFVLRGLSAWVVGVVIGVANFVAVGWEAGTIDVRYDTSSSVSAFAAAVCAAIASALRGNYRYRVEAEARMREAEQGRQAAVERGVAQERLRIARDLHDGVGHQIAVVNMHLGAAEVHLSDPRALRGDLVAARAAVQAVLRETQQILAVLRVDDAGERPQATPSHAVVGDLVESYRQAGMVVNANLGSFGIALSGQSSVAVYRVVQEALTNAHKHGVGPVSLEISQNGEGLVSIEVANMRRSTSSPGPGGGNGLIGMRERVESVGGSLRTRADDRLFWIVATIPADGREAR
ncbi:histidine kinase [Propionibacterium freudenreichii]|uniref:sensor histidine kinase n=1 Tax=Propionibacterium freudenreichii TaxID=1744 RepID=UPI00054274D4|nr:histidine kinase [Propionibacterium freudenreichii]WBF59271.1 histidine kinase [Propionibacterium freudenreichii]WBF64260.1 histidine kinase [Propionibacterium freudenreichii]CEH08022.1 sensor kinase-Membrane protein [Propionibacterium freudenreichii]SBW76226.1 Integral membrane sensor signal transduction histidine kinase [Propionibacterium freudenreichii]